jgi:hypothetical protein
LDQHIHNINNLLKVKRASNLADRLFSNNKDLGATAFSISQTDEVLKAAAVSCPEWLTEARLQAGSRLWIGLQELLGNC